KHYGPVVTEVGGATEAVVWIGGAFVWAGGDTDVGTARIGTTVGFEDTDVGAMAAVGLSSGILGANVGGDAPASVDVAIRGRVTVEVGTGMARVGSGRV